MIKGCSRKIYHVRNISDKYFDEVYFILKDGETLPDSPSTSATLAEEAERIIKEAGVMFRKERSKRTSPLSRLCAFLCGAFTSSAILGIIALLTVLG